METHRLLKTIGEETRLRILVLLLDTELNVTELETTLSTSQSNVSRHLAKLLLTELVTSQRMHHHVYYRINHTKLDQCPFLRQLLNDEKNQLQSLADHDKLVELQSLPTSSNPYIGVEDYSDEYLI